MTFVFYPLPRLEVSRREKKKQKDVHGRTVTGHPPTKYNHWQMLMDAVSGMTWSQVAEKHGVLGSDGLPNAKIAYRIAFNSKATLKLSPDEVKKLQRWKKHDV